MSYPVGMVYVWKGNHRLFPQLLSFNILTACIATALDHTAGRPEEPINRMSFGCRQFNRELHLPILNVVESAAYCARMFGIDLAVTEEVPDSGTLVLSTDAFNTVLTHTIAPLFTDFFENHRPWLEGTAGKNPDLWPEVWNFARVVRNAASHGGSIAWHDRKARPVRWHHITYSHDDHGRQLIGMDLQVGDLLLLMLEMDAELDRLGCPVDCRPKAA